MIIIAVLVSIIITPIVVNKFENNDSKNYGCGFSIFVFIIIFIVSLIILGGFQNRNEKSISQTNNVHQNLNYETDFKNLRHDIDDIGDKIGKINRKLDAPYIGPRTDEAMRADADYMNSLYKERSELIEEYNRSVNEYNQAIDDYSDSILENQNEYTH